MYQPDKLSELVKDRCAGPKPGTLAHFIGWVREKPAAKTYDWFDCYGCLLAQYASAHGASSYVTFFGGPEKTLPIEDIAYERPHTFGAALERALALSKAGATI